MNSPDNSIQYHQTVTERDRDLQNQFGQYSNRMADFEAKMNCWVSKAHILQTLEYPV